MDFLTRRSIRKYQDRELEKEVIEELMKTAVVSPSGKNGRPYEFIVVTDKEKIKKLAHLKAHELGLGSCWLQTKGKFDANGKPCHDNIREILEIPEDIYISNLISLGYPAEERPAYTEKDMDMSKVHYNKW